MKAVEFDEKFDKGEDISDFLDFSQAVRPGREQKRVNVDFPAWMVDALDREAEKIGVTRQAIIKVWISERISERKQAKQSGKIDSDVLMALIAELERQKALLYDVVKSRSSESIPVDTFQ